jgi:predicted type IV restriction endonuclease
MPDIRRPLKKFLPHFLKAKQGALNEADTVQRIILFLNEVLGYDLLSEVTRESQIKSRYVDIAIKLDGHIRLLVEAKSADTMLRMRHLDQAELYAAEGNHPWAVLTNGVVWHLYHLTFDDGVEYENVFEVDLENDDLDHAADKLGMLHRSAILKGEHEDYLRQRQALSPGSLARALFSFDVLTRIRRHVRKREGLLLDIEDLAAGFRQMFSAEARERIGVIRVQRKKRKRKNGDVAPSAAPAAGAPALPTAPPS